LSRDPLSRAPLGAPAKSSSHEGPTREDPIHEGPTREDRINEDLTSVPRKLDRQERPERGGAPTIATFCMKAGNSFQIAKEPLRRRAAYYFTLALPAVIVYMPTVITSASLEDT